jgi:protein MAK11
MAKSSLSTKKGAEKVVKKTRIAEPTERAPKRARIATPPPPKSKAAQKPSKAKSTIAGPSKPTPAGPIASSSSQNRKEKGKAKSSSTDEPQEPTLELPSTFKVVAGSYEKLLYGLNGWTSVNEAGKLEYHLKPIFIFPAHVSCIKAVAASPQGGKWLATGSADEIVKIWDLRRKKEVGGLMHHEGTYRCYILNAFP